MRIRSLKLKKIQLGYVILILNTYAVFSSASCSASKIVFIVLVLTKLYKFLTCNHDAYLNHIDS
jgi:hypothetical protein